MKACWILLVGLLAAAPAAAQQKGPSFDCAKAQSAIDKTICKDAELSKADRDLVTAYTALLDRLKGAEREALVKEQARWIATRNRVCQQQESDEIAYCVKQRYLQRTATLQSMAMAPFVSIGELMLTGSGRFGQVGWSYDISYPRFEAKGVDFEAVNKRYATDAIKTAQEATPKDPDEFEDDRNWNHQQAFAIERPPGGTVAGIMIQYYGFTGGAHGYGATLCEAVDLKTGKFVTPAGVLGGEWRRTVYQLVVADLKRQFKERDFDDMEPLQPEPMNKMLNETARYCWRARQLEVVFNAYDVGPYVLGQFIVEIPYDRLKPVLRADGPIAVR